MTQVFHSNWFFVVSVVVIGAWGALLLRPVLGVEAVECRYRVSERGIVHGPDSPFWGLTAQFPCFDSIEAARDYAINERNGR